MFSFKKYQKLISIGISDALAWRAGYITTAIAFLAGTGALILLWIAIYRSGGQIGTYSLRELIGYYVVSTLIALIFTRTSAFDLVQKIDSGALSSELIKPSSFFTTSLVTDIGNKIALLIINGIPALIIYFFLRDIITLTPKIFLILIPTIVLGYILQAIIGIAFATTSAWIQQRYLPIMLFNVLASMLSGQMIPISLMPQWLKTLAIYSPFPYLFNIPIELLLGRRDNVLPHEVVIGITWLIAMTLLTQFLWKRAAIRYEAGGI